MEGGSAHPTDEPAAPQFLEDRAALGVDQPVGAEHPQLAAGALGLQDRVRDVDGERLPRGQVLGPGLPRVSLANFGGMRFLDQVHRHTGPPFPSGRPAPPQCRDAVTSHPASTP